MSEKFSSPGGGSATSGGSNKQTPTKQQKQGSSTIATTSTGAEDPFLVIRIQPPSFVFPGEMFETEFGIEAARGARHSPPTDLDIGAILQVVTRGAGKAELHKAKIILLEEPRISASRRSGKVRCRVDYGKVPSDGATYCIRIYAKGGRNVAPVVTSDIHLVNSKIRISPSSDWSHVWYKDEGGRDKSMEVVVGAYNRENKIVLETIPLQITLCYSGSNEPIPVSNQDILRLLGSERRLQIDKTTGTTKVRFRIEDVSKNHQGQDFLLEIGAETKGFQDVAPGLTPPVSIRSKRNKRQRVPSSVSSERGRSSPGMNRSSLGHYPQEPSSTPVVFEHADSGRLREAVEGVAKWAEDVVNGIYPLQWQVLGYAQHPDGNPDYNRPYHSMTNPNSFISRILSMYNETREHLHVLRQAVDSFGPAYHHDEMQYPSALPPAHEQYGIMPPSYPQPPPRQHPRMRSMSPGSFHGPDAMMMPHEDPNYTRSAHPDYFGQPGAAAHGPPRMGDSPEPLVVKPTQPPLHTSPVPQDRSHLQRSTGRDRDSAEDMKPPAKPNASTHLSAVAAHHADPRFGTNDEMQVEYVLAKEYKSLRTGERLGFPAYSTTKQILGFYREIAGSKVGGRRFAPIRMHLQEFGPNEIVQATHVLEQAIARKSGAVHALKDWGSIRSLMDHVLVYDWTKDISSTSIGSNRSSASGEI